MIIFVFWILFAVLVAVYAERKGRSGAGFFFLSLFLSPLIGFIIAAAVESKKQKVAERSGMKKCPDCAEYVQGEARVCRFCGYKFAAVDMEAEASEGRYDAIPSPSTSEAGSDSPNSNHEKQCAVFSPVWGVVAVVVIVVCLVILGRSTGCDSNQDQAVQQQAPLAPRVQAFNTGNPANDRLLALPQSDQAAALGAIAGEGCVGYRAFYMGIFSSKSPHQTKEEQRLAAILSMDHEAFWSVGCTNGASYEVGISADAAGSTKVLDCSVLRAIAKTDCFVRFKDQ